MIDIQNGLIKTEKLYVVIFFIFDQIQISLLLSCRFQFPCLKIEILLTKMKMFLRYMYILRREC